MGEIGRQGQNSCGIQLRVSNAMCSVHTADLRHDRDRHGGYGYISSWGSASVALDLLEGALLVAE